MPELAVDPTVLLDVAGPLGAAADRLAALAAGLPLSETDLGPDDLVDALEDAAHTWQHALRAAAIAVGAMRDQLLSAAAAYDAVDAVVSDWSSP